MDETIKWLMGRIARVLENAEAQRKKAVIIASKIDDVDERSRLRHYRAAQLCLIATSQVQAANTYLFAELRKPKTGDDDEKVAWFLEHMARKSKSTGLSVESTAQAIFDAVEVLVAGAEQNMRDVELRVDE